MTHTNTHTHARTIKFQDEKKITRKDLNERVDIFFALCVCVSLKRNAEAAITLGHIFTCSAKAAQANSTQQVEIRNRKCVVSFPFLP